MAESEFSVGDIVLVSDIYEEDYDPDDVFTFFAEVTGLFINDAGEHRVWIKYTLDGAGTYIGAWPPEALTKQ